MNILKKKDKKGDQKDMIYSLWNIHDFIKPSCPEWIDKVTSTSNSWPLIRICSTCSTSLCFQKLDQYLALKRCSINIHYIKKKKPANSLSLTSIFLAEKHWVAKVLQHFVCQLTSLKTRKKQTNKTLPWNPAYETEKVEGESKSLSTTTHPHPSHPFPSQHFHRALGCQEQWP